jgi:transcriptional regulator with XRE-family HTH domain
MVGISANAMNAIEADTADPKASRILRIAQVLEVSTDYLYGHTVRRRPHEDWPAALAMV